MMRISVYGFLFAYILVMIATASYLNQETAHNLKNYQANLTSEWPDTTGMIPIGGGGGGDGEGNTTDTYVYMDEKTGEVFGFYFRNGHLVEKKYLYNAKVGSVGGN